MAKKRGIKGLLIIMVLAILVYPGYIIAKNINQKIADETLARKLAKEAHIEFLYEMQNGAFTNIHESKYMPYRKEYEWILQVHIIFYTRDTGKTVTLNDVEAFLATSENPNGTQRTWKDDETGIVRDFVDWYTENAGYLKTYRSELDRAFSRYRQQHPGCPYEIVNDLTPSQIIELDKKYIDPGYDLVLEW
jgi:hypothetical protein